MSKLTQLQGHSQKFKIGDTELELKPLTVEDIALFSVDNNAPIEQQMEMTKRLMTKVLKDSVPDATDEEIAKISLEHLDALMKAIMKLHKMSEGDSKIQRIKDVIKARQTQAKSNRKV